MLISVIIPMYNASLTIEKAINSVISQGNKYEIEVIIVNDGSTDNSLDIAYSLKNKYIDIINIVIINQSNKGVATARNVGVASSNGEYIAFLDSDDQWLNNKINLQMDVFNKSNDIDLVAGNFQGLNVNFNKLKKLYDNIYLVTFNQLLRKHYFQPSTVILKRDAFESVGGFKDGMTHGEEGLLFYNICFKYSCVIISKDVIQYGDDKHPYASGNGLASNLLKMEKSELSNYYTMFKIGNISFFRFTNLFMFSILKFFRRVLITKVLNA
ncbi:glycosyltransferase family 2 protein [Photobacterium leiognathi]|uniref:glycosyltransferase family 2 protein n=1 Tax=Photobacterium leiognathi TaxID=553611 RepID=UPI0029821CF1|nr:glycosyltransferase family A protein [Photobacterium leiognathi]